MAKSNPTPPQGGLFYDGEHGLLIPGTQAPKACPFCASLEIEVTLSCEGSDGLPDAHVAGCTGCGTQGPAGQTRLEAAELWNRRKAKRGQV
jgi:hypothetical protein